MIAVLIVFAMTATLFFLATRPWLGMGGKPVGLRSTADLREGAGWLDGLSERALRAAAAPSRGEPHPAPRTPLGPVVDRAIAAALSATRQGLRHWKVDPALRALAVRVEPAALEAALAVLLRRAALHTRDGDIIALRWEKGSEWVAFVVEDEGDGLLPPGTETDAAGVLLGGDVGLSQARRLATAQGGDVRIEATPGIGARAWLTLPRERVLESA